VRRKSKPISDVDVPVAPPIKEKRLDVGCWAKETFGTLKSHSPPRLVNPKKVAAKKTQKKVAPNKVNASRAAPRAKKTLELRAGPSGEDTSEALVIGRSDCSADKVNAPRAAPRAKKTLELRAGPSGEDTSEAVVIGRSDCSEATPKEKRRRWSLKSGLRSPQERRVDEPRNTEEDRPPREESGNAEEDMIEFSLPVAAPECESTAIGVESEEDFIPAVQGTTIEVEGRRDEMIEGRTSGVEDALKNESLSATDCGDVIEFQGHHQVDGAAHWQALAVATWKFTMAEQSYNEAEAALSASRARASALKQSLESAREELQELRNAAVRLNSGHQKTVTSPKIKRQRRV